MHPTEMHSCCILILSAGSRISQKGVHQPIIWQNVPITAWIWKKCTNECIPSTTLGLANYSVSSQKNSNSSVLYSSQRKIGDVFTERNGQKAKLLELQNIENRPKTSFTYSIRVRHSDTDYNYHTNHASYFQFCMDAAADGAKLGHFQLVKGDLLSYPI